MLNKTIKKQDGFTLIEIAIVILIGGLILATASSLLLAHIKRVEITTTERRLEIIDEALGLFLNFNGRYPCAAPLNAPVDSTTFGVEVSAIDCSTAAVVPGQTIKVAGRDGRTIRIGSLPVRTLNLPDDMIADAWGSRFTYAVTEILATPNGYDRTEGGIFAVDSDNPADPVTDSVITPPGSAHYVVVSHGPNRSGSTAIAGSGSLPCLAGTLEEENCNNDAVFRRSLLTSTGNNASIFDDFVSLKATSPLGNQIPAGAVMAFELSACPQGWVNFVAGDSRVIVGAGTEYNLANTGGDKELILTEDQVGFRVHPTPIDPSGIPGSVYFAESPTSGFTATAHSNMPPFIALLYCKKT